MTNSGPSPVRGRQPSGVMDAILDAVAESSPDELAREPKVFRDRAFARVDIPKHIDKLLPITTPKIWIALVGVALLLLAGGIYAAGTPLVMSVTTVGRVVAASGVVRVESPVDMSLGKLEVGEGQDVIEGELLGTGTASTGRPADLRSPSGGTVWQILATPGQALAVGDALLTVLPTGSNDNVLVPVEEAAAQGIQVGQKATITSAGLDSPGLVSNVSTTPLSGVRAAEMTALALDPLATYVLVSITADNSVAYGAAVGVEIIESESTVLREIVSVN